MRTNLFSLLILAIIFGVQRLVVEDKNIFDI